MPDRPVPPELVAAAELADMLGVSRQRVSQLTRDGAEFGFPEPWVRLKAGKIWLASDVRAWAAGRRDRRP